MKFGFDPEAPGFFWCAGQGGMGIQTAPAASLLCAALIRGEALPAELAGIDPADFQPALAWRCASAAAQASASTRSFSAWPLWPLTQCHSIRCGATASSSSCHSSAFLTGLRSEVRQPLRCQPWIQRVMPSRT